MSAKSSIKPPVILAIDCSDRVCSIALGDEKALVEEYTDEPRQHAKKLLPMYRDLLAKSSYQQSDIDAIAIAEGPGSFTGLRIGFSFAQGLAFSLSVPLVQVSSLEALAVSYLDKTELISNKGVNQIQACLDARMGELYIAAFHVSPDGLLVRQLDDALIGESEFDMESDYSSAALLGSGFSLDTMSRLQAPVIEAEACISATAVHRIGLGLFLQGKTNEAVGAEPAYLRRENAWKNVSEQKRHQKKKQQQAKVKNSG